MSTAIDTRDRRDPIAFLEALPAYWTRLLSRALGAANMFALSRTRLPILVLGETGTGKSTLARALHESFSGDKAYVAINAASLGTALFMSEMFGHERGAFTGAHTAKKGLVAAADGGMLFLDEVGELSAECQAHLLTFLDTGTFRAVGGVRECRSDARIVAATNRNLEELVQEGRFREDLYYRLASVVIRVPALRERREDIPDLARYLIDQAAAHYRVESPTLLPDALDVITRCEWPGNVRQLRFVMERIAVTWPGEALDAAHVAPLLPAVTPSRADKPRGVRPLSELERDAVRTALLETGGNRTRAAELLGITPRGLYNKIKKFALELEL